jgi:hypothetical protein
MRKEYIHLREANMTEQPSKASWGLVVIAVVMVFMAGLTDIYWVASWIGRPFPRSVPLEPEAARAFALPDIVGSLLMYMGAVGLLKRRTWGFYLTLIAMGMSLGSSLFFLSLTKTTFFNILGPTIFFTLFTLVYLWFQRRHFFSEAETKG